MNTSYETIDFEFESGVAVLSLNRPEAANAINLQMATELRDLTRHCCTLDDLAALIILANGSSFCVGGDLAELNAQGADVPAHVDKMAGAYHAALENLAALTAPVIIGVNGIAAGGGFSIVTAADYVFATPKTKFVSAYTSSYLTPDGSMTYNLARHVGLLRAKELVLTNRVLTAGEAATWGLVNKVVEAEELRHSAMALAASFSVSQKTAIGKTKALLETTYRNSLAEQLELEQDGIVGQVSEPETQAKIEAFLRR